MVIGLVLQKDSDDNTDNTFQHLFEDQNKQSRLFSHISKKNSTTALDFSTRIYRYEIVKSHFYLNAVGSITKNTVRTQKLGMKRSSLHS